MTWLLVLLVLIMPAHAYERREAESWLQERRRLCSDPRLPLELYDAFCKPPRPPAPQPREGEGGVRRR
jgi:hypothetical protein